MKKTLCLIAIFCISQIGYSQSDFREGFIVNLNQDTTIGLIKYKEGNATYRSCQFKKNASQDIVLYAPDDITGYGFENDKFFQSKKIETSVQGSESVFLEVLISGKVILYKYENVFYIEKTEQGLLKLSNKTTNAETKEVTQSTSYLGVLNILLKDCPEISQSRIFNTSFNEKSLTDLVEKYNKSMNSPMVIYKQNKPWIHARVGITGGLISSKITLESNNDAFTHLGTFERLNSPVAGFSVELSLPRINEKVSVITNFLFCSSTYELHREDELFHKITNDYVTIDMSHLKIPIGLRYTFQGRKLSSFINFGLSQTITLNSESDWTRTVENITLFDTYQHDQALEISKTQAGIWGGAGISKSISKGLNVYIELRYEKTDGINAEDFILVEEANVKNILFVIGFSTR
jgi:hypothetical protein